jgi:hypothetical protein
MHIVTSTKRPAPPLLDHPHPLACIFWVLPSLGGCAGHWAELQKFDRQQLVVQTVLAKLFLAEPLAIMPDKAHIASIPL